MNTRLDKMTAKLIKEIPDGDTESAHKKADLLLCNLLKLLGCKETVKAFNALEKWYS